MKKKSLLALLIIVILLGAGIAYAYFATDAFKTEKEMFFSYLFEDESVNILAEEKVVEYIEKQQNTAYTNKGELTFNLTGEDSLVNDESLEMLNNSKVTFEGKTDVSKKLAEQKITADFAQGFNVPLEFKRDGDTYGIQTDLISSRFIAIKNENLNALFKRFGMETEGIPDKIEFKDEKFTKEEIKTLKDRYLAILDENLDESLFSKEKVNNQTIIKLNMSEEVALNLTKKILETVRNDDILLSRTPDATKQQVQSEIDEILEDLKETEVDESNKIEIKLYVESKSVKKCELAVIENDETSGLMVLEITNNSMTLKAYAEQELFAEMSILKEKTGNDITYKITMKLNSEYEESVELSLTMQYKNVLALDNVEEIYDIKISVEDNEEINLIYNNIKTFSPDVQIESLNESNPIIINDATDEELQTLILNFYQKMGLI